MRRLPPGSTVAVRMAIIGVAASGLAACGSGGSGSGAQAQIEQNWTTFFAHSSPAAQKVTLLQDGGQYFQVLRQLAQSSLAQQSGVRIGNVTVHGDTADVTYTLLRGSTPVLQNRTGQAVLVDGVWKVSDATFCSLVTLARPAPPGCASAASTASGSSG